MREPLRLTTTTAPATLPVALNEAKAHLNLGDDFVADDALITGYINAAVTQCERFTRRTLITTTYTLFLDDWPSDLGKDLWWDGVREGSLSMLRRENKWLTLPRPPLQSVVHVKTYTDSDVASTYATSNYFVDTATEPGRVVLRTGAASPAPTRVANGLEVQFTAGYGDNPADVPEPLRDGILRLVAYLYENRGECPVEEAVGNSGASAMWYNYRLLRL